MSERSLALLNALLSPNNAARSEAERWIQESVASGAGPLAQELLLALAARDWNPSHRVLAAVLLRRSIVANQGVWAALTPGDRHMVWVGSLSVVRTGEAVAEARRAAADCVAAAAQASLGLADDASFEAVSWAVEAVRSGAGDVAGCELLERLIREAPPCVLRSSHVFDEVVATLLGGARDAAGVARVALALCAEAETAAQLEACSTLVPGAVVRNALCCAGSTAQLDALRGLYDLVSDEFEQRRSYALLALHVDALSRAALEVAAAPAAAEEARALSLALVGALVEMFDPDSRPLAAAAAPVALRALAEGPPDLVADEEWSQRSTEDDEDDDEDGDDGELEDDRLGAAACATLEAIAQTHRGERLLRASAPILGELLRSPSARARRAALIGLAVVGDATEDGGFFASEFVPAVMPTVCSLATVDPSLRVRDAALNCLAQFAIDFRDVEMERDLDEEEAFFFDGFGEEVPRARPDTFQARYAAVYVPACVDAIERGAGALRSLAESSEDDRWAKTRNGRTAAGALANFCHPALCDPAALEAHAERAFKACARAIEEAPLGSAARAATAAACVAQCCRADLWRDVGFPAVAPRLVHLLQATAQRLGQSRAAAHNATSHHHDALHAASCLGRCLEALTLCGAAAGVDIFWPAVGDAFAAVLRDARDSFGCADSDAHLTRHWLGAAARAVALVATPAGAAADAALRADLVRQVSARAVDQAQKGVDLGVFDSKPAAAHFATEHAGSEVVEVGSARRGGAQYIVLNSAALRTSEVAMRALFEVAKTPLGAAEMARLFGGGIATTLSQIIADAPWIAFAPTVVLILSATVAKLMHEDALRAAQLHPHATDLLRRVLPNLVRGLNPWVQRAATRDEASEAGLAALDAAVSVAEAVSEALRAAFHLGATLPGTDALVEATIAVCCEAIALRNNNNNNNNRPPDTRSERAEDALATLVSHAADAMGYLIKITKDASLFDRTALGPLAKRCFEHPQGASHDLQVFGLCAAVDAVEHCGASADRIASVAREHLLRAAQSEAATVRQAGCYGLGVVVARPSGGAKPAADFVKRACDVLVRAAQVYNPDLDEDGTMAMAHDNALASLVTILLDRPDDLAEMYGASAEQLGLFVFRSLPLCHDVAEARKVHAKLVDALCGGAHLKRHSPLALAARDANEVGRCLSDIAADQAAPPWALALVNGATLQLAQSLHVRRRFGADPAAAQAAAQALVQEYQLAAPETRAKIARLFQRAQ